MRSPAISIGWELWNRTRPGSALVLGAIPVCYLVQVLPFARPIRETISAFELIAMLLALATIFWIHSYAETDQRGNHSGFPARLFILPLRTATLVAWPMIFGVAAVVLFYFAWSRLVFPHWGVDLSWSWLRCQLLGLAAMMACLQAIIWSFHRFPWIRFILVGIALIGLGAFGIVMPAQDFPALGENGTIVCLVFILLLAYVGAVFGVQRDRHGGWEGWTGRLLQRLLDALPGRRADFRGLAPAQFWFEWRRKGLFLACLLALLTAATVMTLPVPSALYLDKAQTWLTYASLPIMIAIGALTVGLGLAKSDFWRRDTALHPFMAMRPMTVGDLVIAKMKVAALIVFVGLFVFSIMAIPAFNLFRWLGNDFFPSWSKFKAENAALIQWAAHPLTILTTLAVTWKAIVNGMCVGLTGRRRAILWRSWLGGTIFILFIAVVLWLVRHPAHYSKFLPALVWLAITMLLFKVATTVWTMRAAGTRRLYSKGQLCCLSAIWIGIAVCILANGLLLASPNLDHQLIFFAVAWLFPDSSLARCAMNLASNRHR